MTKSEFLERAREKHGYKYQYPYLSDKVLSNDNIIIVYNGIEYKQKVVKHILLGRCPEKNTPIKTTDEFVKESIKVWGNKYDYSLVEYKGALEKVRVIFDGIVFEQVATSHLKYAPEGNMNQEYFIKLAKDKWNDKYDYSLVDYKHCKSKVKIIYNDEIYEQTPDNHLIHSPEKVLKRKTNEQFIKESNIVHDNKYNYKNVEYKTNQTKVVINCPIHGDFNQIPLSHLQGSGCPNCNESKGEKEISKFLDKYDILYYRQHKFNDCKNIFSLPFDFYIPSVRICIEFDGKQHYEPMSFFGGVESFDKIKINDKIKNDYCEENYINLIRIKYDQIDNIFQFLWENLRMYIKKPN